MGLEYVNIIYHHSSDPKTPLKKTIVALDLMVRQGKALSISIPNYQSERITEAFKN